MTKRAWLVLAQIAVLFIQLGVLLSALLKPIRVSCPPPPCCCDDTDGGGDGRD